MYLHEIQSVIQTLDSIIYPLGKCEVNIYESVMQTYYHEATYSWGVAFPDPNNHRFTILVDTSAVLETQDVIHELIHNYINEYLPKDSTSLFFAESLTEYLAVCLKYKDVHVRDSVFNRKFMESCFKGLGKYSVLRPSEYQNQLGEYSHTPFKIHVFAQIIGEDKFISLLGVFYRESRKNNGMSFDLFEKICKQYGITDEQWNWFKKTL
ncbi:MAG: hypothetical protein LBR36_09580 [Bacteroidales bacterium]|nr:hypothetical protein [Bacteroidales bacterium]